MHQLVHQLFRDHPLPPIGPGRSVLIPTQPNNFSAKGRSECSWNASEGPWRRLGCGTHAPRERRSDGRAASWTVPGLRGFAYRASRGARSHVKWDVRPRRATGRGKSPLLGVFAPLPIPRGTKTLPRRWTQPLEIARRAIKLWSGAESSVSGLNAHRGSAPPKYPLRAVAHTARRKVCALFDVCRRDAPAHVKAGNAQVGSASRGVVVLRVE